MLLQSVMSTDMSPPNATSIQFYEIWNGIKLINGYQSETVVYINEVFDGSRVHTGEFVSMCSAVGH